ncbi:hypothetical protein RRG08_065968 [Elysia crispata]|uniref:Uncharacterized protein n=1 Tax=Elysia crispata TaxID=231223 RepID=A0AAE1DFE9_9GAST|nr:hypothetical protein RRG08_065968 [Elysia crispata]
MRACRLLATPSESVDQALSEKQDWVTSRLRVESEMISSKSLKSLSSGELIKPGPRDICGLRTALSKIELESSKYAFSKKISMAESKRCDENTSYKEAIVYNKNRPSKVKVNNKVRHEEWLSCKTKGCGGRK